MRALYAITVLVVFFRGVWPRLTYRFDSDDIMNLHQGYVVPATELLRDLVFPFTAFNRPLGALYYRLCFDLFGWNPPAFRTVTIALMVANLALVYLLARRLTGSIEMGAMAALLFSFHGRLVGMYASNGTVYDVLCALFSLLTVWYYVRVRQESRRWNLLRIVILLSFYIAALNAKEMAALIPVLLLVYEWCYYPRRNLWRNAWIAVALTVLTGAALWSKTRTGGPFDGQAMYASAFTVRRFFQNERTLLSQLFYLPDRTLSTKQVLLLWAALFTIPVWVEPRLRKALWFSAAFAVLTPLPIIFIPTRGFYVMYLPLAGWAIYSSILLVIVRDWSIREIRSRSPMPAKEWTAARIALSWGIAMAVTTAGTLQVNPMSPIIEETKADFLKLNEPLRANSRNLLIHSRFPDDSWDPLMIARLLYRDPGLWLDRPELMNAPLTAAALADYDCVFDFDGKKMFVVAKRAVGGVPGRPVKFPR